MYNSLMDLLISSSSSESSDEEVLMINELINAEIMVLQQLISKNKTHSVLNFMEEVVYNYTDEEFRKHFRVKRRTAEILTEKFGNSIYFRKRQNNSGRKALSSETQCLAFLWFAGNKNTYREVANLFNISISSAYKFQSRFLEFLFEISPSLIKMPSTTAAKEEISQEFAKLSGFQNVIGCIDGCYMYIRNPAHKIRSTYANRHGLLSITMQGICDANKKFLDVFVGSTSKIHDSKIFKISKIGKDIARICEGKYHLLGDAAYPLREYLLTPYRDYGDLTDQQKKYNKKHCQTWVKIENSFGLLKQRFRQLIRLDYYTVGRMAKFVLGCCVLHNLCIDEGDLWADITDDTQQQAVTMEGGNARDRDDESVLEAILLQKGEIKRNAITVLI